MVAIAESMARPRSKTVNAPYPPPVPESPSDDPSPGYIKNTRVEEFVESETTNAPPVEDEEYQPGLPFPENT